MSEEPWRELVDLESLRRWMDLQGVEAGPLHSPVPLQGGTQNVMLRFQRGERSLVLRRPPRHPRMNGSETMRREARVLTALADTDVPHPRIVAVCADEDVLGAAFYLMEPVTGFNANLGLPPRHAGDAEIRRRMGLALVDGIAALAEVDHVAAGLSGLGRVEGFLDRQVGRWRRQLDGYHEYQGWPGPTDLPGVDAIAGWLDRNRPRAFRAGIIHGDYHLANVLFRFDGPELAAIVDWELSTIGDPLVDLGWVLATWPRPGGDGIGTVGAEPWAGFPTAEGLVARYAERSTRELSGVWWYAVLGCYKLAILQEGTYARACAGKAPMETGLRLHWASKGLLERALMWIEHR